jgi:hypothetical protein
MASISAMLLLHALFDRRLIVGVLDLVERRRLERQLAGTEKRIAGHAVAAGAALLAAAVDAAGAVAGLGGVLRGLRTGGESHRGGDHDRLRRRALGNSP